MSLKYEQVDTVEDNTKVFILTRKVDVRLPGKGNSNSHGARPVHLIITTIKWIPTSRLSIKNSLSLAGAQLGDAWLGLTGCVQHVPRQQIDKTPVQIATSWYK